MTSKKYLITDGEVQKRLLIDAKFNDLRRLYICGNKMALHDAIALSNDANVGLPIWAAEAAQKSIYDQWEHRKTKWKGTDKGKDIAGISGFIAILKSYVRATVYSRAALWSSDIDKYRLQPTRTVGLWFEGKLKQPTNEKEILEVALEGLLGTFAYCSISTLEDYQYYDQLPGLKKFSFFNPEAAREEDMTPREYDAFIKAQFRETRSLPLEFGYSDTEVVFDLRPAGQFWGPSEEPPLHIQKLLS